MSDKNQFTFRIEGMTCDGCAWRGGRCERPRRETLPHEAALGGPLLHGLGHRGARGHQRTDARDRPHCHGGDRSEPVPDDGERRPQPCGAGSRSPRGPMAGHPRGGVGRRWRKRRRWDRRAAASRQSGDTGFSLSGRSRELGEVPAWQLHVFRSTRGEMVRPDDLGRRPADLVLDALIGYSLEGAPTGCSPTSSDGRTPRGDRSSRWTFPPESTRPRVRPLATTFTRRPR